MPDRISTAHILRSSQSAFCAPEIEKLDCIHADISGLGLLVRE